LESELWEFVDELNADVEHRHEQIVCFINRLFPRLQRVAGEVAAIAASNGFRNLAILLPMPTKAQDGSRKTDWASFDRLDDYENVIDGEKVFIRQKHSARNKSE
jgi:hypothetical protein